MDKVIEAHLVVAVPAGKEEDLPLLVFPWVKDVVAASAEGAEGRRVNTDQR